MLVHRRIEPKIVIIFELAEKILNIYNNLILLCHLWERWEQRRAFGCITLRNVKI